MYSDKMTVHRTHLREQLASIAENIHMVDVAISKMATALDNVDVCQEDLNDHVVNMHVRLSSAHGMLDDFDESVGGLPHKE